MMGAKERGFLPSVNVSLDVLVPTLGHMSCPRYVHLLWQENG